MKFSPAVAVAGLAATAGAVPAASSPSPSASAAPSPSAWPCPLKDGHQEFALRVVNGAYNHTLLGVSPDGNNPVGVPSVHKTTALWYLKAGQLFVDAATTRNASTLAHVPVGTEPIDQDPRDGFQQKFVFQTPGFSCPSNGGFGYCTNVTCHVTAVPAQQYGILNCTTDHLFIELGDASDAPVGIWDPSQSAGGIYGEPAQSIRLALVPNCKL